MTEIDNASIGTDLIRTKLPNNDILLTHPIRRHIPFFRNPARIWKGTMGRLREDIYGENFKKVTAEDLKTLFDIQSEISNWLSNEAKPETYQPANAFSVRAILGSATPDLTHCCGFFISSDKNNEICSYLIKTASGWPVELNQSLNGLAKNYDSFFFLRHAKSDSLWFSIHPDETYNLKIKFAAVPHGRLRTYEPSALALKDMPQGEYSLLLAELQGLNSVKDTLVKPEVLAIMESKKASEGLNYPLQILQDQSVQPRQMAETKAQQEARIKKEDAQALERYKKWKKKLGIKPTVG